MDGDRANKGLGPRPAAGQSDVTSSGAPSPVQLRQIRNQRDQRAQKHNQEHAAEAAEFQQLTGIDPLKIQAVRRWQSEHGLPVDGKIGDQVVSAARGGSGAGATESPRSTSGAAETQAASAPPTDKPAKLSSRAPASEVESSPTETDSPLADANSPAAATSSAGQAEHEQTEASREDPGNNRSDAEEMQPQVSMLPGGNIALEIASSEVPNQSADTAVIPKGAKVRILSREEYDTAVATQGPAAGDESAQQQPRGDASQSTAAGDALQSTGGAASQSLPDVASADGGPQAADMSDADRDAAANDSIGFENVKDAYETAKHGLKLPREIAKLANDVVSLPAAVAKWEEAPKALKDLAESLLEKPSVKLAQELSKQVKQLAGWVTNPITEGQKALGKHAGGLLKAAKEPADQIARDASERALKALEKGRQYTLAELKQIAVKATSGALLEAKQPIENGPTRAVVAHEAEHAVAQDLIVEAEKRGAVIAAEKTAAEGVAKAVARSAAKVAVRKEAGKVLARIIPGLNIAVVGAATLASGIKAVQSFKQGNIVGGIIETFHTGTNAAGFAGPLGTVVSLLGDAATIGLHWATKR